MLKIEAYVGLQGREISSGTQVGRLLMLKFRPTRRPAGPGRQRNSYASCASLINWPKVTFPTDE